jgi:hypothetical protein
VQGERVGSGRSRAAFYGIVRARTEREPVGGSRRGSKELIAGYVIVSAESLEEASRRAMEYIAAVQAGEVDVREVEE